MRDDNEFNKILALFHYPKFVEFELDLDSPTVFNAVGRTHTERWHSALLGWLLDPMGSHSLNAFPLSRFILLLVNKDNLTSADRNFDLEIMTSPELNLQSHMV
jgi:hypothetical protein